MAYTREDRRRLILCASAGEAFSLCGFVAWMLGGGGEWLWMVLAVFGMVTNAFTLGWGLASETVEGRRGEP